VAVEPRDAELRRELDEPLLPHHHAAGAPVRQTSLWRDAVYRYARNRGALVAAVIFGLIILYCLIWPIISPYDPNEIKFSESLQGPSLAHPFGTSSSASPTARSRASSAAGSTTG
jgi:hypothetical protein